MTALIVFMAIFGLGFVALGLANHRAIWWRFQARRYADPAAHEPSDAGFVVQRVLCLAVAAMAFWASFDLYRTVTPDGVDHDELLERVRSVAQTLDGGTKPSVLGTDEGGTLDRSRTPRPREGRPHRLARVEFGPAATGRQRGALRRER
ncbi:hypothetical protein GCM10010271_49330 [Streptomyces kurssanovii]|nr:hypothetical protein GCM10010271_49330 [Streptomyces kurssanovii]